MSIRSDGQCQRRPRPSQPPTPWADLPDETARWARDVLAGVTSTGADDVALVRLLRDGDKCLAVLERHRGRPLVLKQYANDRGAWTRRWLQRLAEAGLAAPGRFRVTPAQGWSAPHHTLVADLALGRAWGDWLTVVGQDRDAAAVAAADWLTTLQALSVALPDRTAHRSVADLRRQATQLAAAFPDVAPRLNRVAEAVPRVLAARDAGSPVPSHGDLHPNNLHVSLGTPLVVTAIDVDTAGMRRPSYDVGYALAQLLIFSWQRSGSFRAGAAAGRTFWQRWAATGDDLDAVPAEVARTLVQSLHFELVTYRTGQTDLLPRWLQLAQTALDGGVDATLAQAEAEEEVRS